MAEAQRQVDLRQGYYAAMRSLETGTYKGSGDIIDWSYYDTLTLSNTVLNHRLFTVGLGATKTLADTNILGRGMPQGQKMYVQAIKVMYFGDEARTPAERINQLDMMADTTLNFYIPGKDTYGQWTLAEIFGIADGNVMSDAAGDSELASKGRFVGIYPLNLPIVLAQQVDFEIQIVHHVAPAADLNDDRIKISLNGILERLS